MLFDCLARVSRLSVPSFASRPLVSMVHGPGVRGRGGWNLGADVRQLVRGDQLAGLEERQVGDHAGVEAGAAVFHAEGLHLRPVAEQRQRAEQLAGRRRRGAGDIGGEPGEDLARDRPGWRRWRRRGCQEPGGVSDSWATLYWSGSGIRDQTGPLYLTHAIPSCRPGRTGEHFRRGGAGSSARAGGRQPTFRAGVTLVTTDVIPRDDKGRFVADLTRENFTVLEDGQPQVISSFSLVHGGRTFNLLAPPPAAAGRARGHRAAARRAAASTTPPAACS